MAQTDEMTKDSATAARIGLGHPIAESMMSKNPSPNSDHATICAAVAACAVPVTCAM